MLRGEQRFERQAAASAECELQQELDPDVSDMLDRGVEPRLCRPPAGRGRLQAVPVPSAVRAGTTSGDEALFDQPVDGAVRERAAERPDAAELTLGGEQRPDRPAVRDALGHECEADVLGQARGGRHRRIVGRPLSAVNHFMTLKY